jgi:hypothetical protein
MQRTRLIVVGLLLVASVVAVRAQHWDSVRPRQAQAARPVLPHTLPRQEVSLETPYAPLPADDNPVPVPPGPTPVRCDCPPPPPPIAPQHDYHVNSTTRVVTGDIVIDWSISVVSTWAVRFFKVAIVFVALAFVCLVLAAWAAAAQTVYVRVDGNLGTPAAVIAVLVVVLFGIFACQ